MAPPRKDPVDREAFLSRIDRVAQLVKTPPKFKVGDLLTYNPDAYGPKLMDAVARAGAYPIFQVVVTHDSWREVSVSRGMTELEAEFMPECQALYMVTIDTDGDTTFQWANAWSYMHAPKELLSVAPIGSLNH